MKKKTIFAVSTALMLSLSACSSMQSLGGLGNPLNGNTSTSTGLGNNGGGSNLLGNLLGSLVGEAVPLTQQTLLGTWSYSAPAVRFESENALMEAGGTVGAAAVEEKLVSVYSMIGIKQGSCSFTFGNDGSCQIQLGRIPVNGTYTLDTKTRTLVISTGMFTLNAKVYYNLNTLTVLFDAKKLLQLTQTIANFTGQANSTIATLSSLVNSYDGMQLGMDLKK